MNRLHAELQRLYLLPPAADTTEGGPLAGPQGERRALVLELTGPADWDVLSRVWLGVQADLQLPAPAIAVSGTDGLQLWFSLQQPVDAARAAGFLARLAARYLGDVAPGRVRCMPSASGPDWQAPLVPALQAGTENWSAFVAPDLAPVFAGTPWLDVAPGADGQADLLARLDSIPPAALEAAMAALQGPTPATATAPTPPAPGAARQEAGGDLDPRRFLQRVLNDEAVALALRIEAAKALLH